ncbi:peptidylprolyl isomerase [Phenylobacterium sp.]|uniref:peptidylprolyl isomerase n=1 Tax=Phenylobacterium sp. TaxID=1871053 RepID=UPI0026335F14|nr:peptidylprolyl isomerase [Phenylobacterium sp.]
MMRRCNLTALAARSATLSVLFALPAFAATAQTADSAAAPPPPAAAQPPAAAEPAPAPAPPKGLSESVAAVVNDDIISTYDLGQRVRLLAATSGVQPTQETLPQFEREALISLIDEHLQMQELKRIEKEQKFKIIASDKDVEEELDGMAKQANTTKPQFLAALGKAGVSPETIRQQLKAQISWRDYIRGRYGSRLRIGEDQIKAVQTMLQADASKPQYEVSEVFIDASRVGGMNQAMQGAQQLISQMQQGAPFAAVARQFSASPTAAAGGEAGWISPGEMPPEVDAALEQLRPGQLSAPIPVKDGVYIIYLRDKRSGAGETLVSLKQAAIALPQNASQADIDAARTKLEALRPQIKGCNGLEAAAAKTPGVVAGDLGEAQISDLAPQFKSAAQSLQVGQVSEPIRTNVGLHLVALCGRHAAGSEMPNHDQIENRLYGEQLSMIARRYMRDLRSSATIETR